MEPDQANNIEEILIQGEASQMMVKDKTISVIGFDMSTLKVEGIKDIRDLFTNHIDRAARWHAEKRIHGIHRRLWEQVGLGHQ